MALSMTAMARDGIEADRWRAMSADAQRTLVVSLIQDRQTWMAEFAASPDDRVRRDAKEFLDCDDRETLVGRADTVRREIDVHYGKPENACHTPNAVLVAYLDQLCRIEGPQPPSTLAPCV
ncbi:MAG: hypothetical protein GC145_14685 [Caulobacter sp.]|nr:hypothetical protein [Caulobacter sp.]